MRSISTFISSVYKKPRKTLFWNAAKKLVEAKENKQGLVKKLVTIKVPTSVTARSGVYDLKLKPSKVDK